MFSVGTSVDWAEGQVVADRYKLLAPLGRGGMGAVWRAEHVKLRSAVALKRMDPAIAQHEEAIARFEHEAQAAAALRSTHVVQILDHGVDHGVPYIAMELLHGESLAERLARMGVLGAAQTITIMSQVARAVSRAHEAGIVHRDLKPDNIFLVNEGEQEVVKVLDFGIAKRKNTEGEQTGPRTRTGALIGTPYYMSPEQARGNKTVDHRSDLWAMGVIAYECLFGRRPFESESLGDLVLKICSEPVPVPSSHGQAWAPLDRWFARAAERDPSARFQSATELIAGLRQALEGLEGTPTPGRVIAEAPADPRTNRASAATTGAVSAAEISASTVGASRRPWLLLSGVGAALVLAGLVAWTWGSRAAASAEAPAAAAMPSTLALPAPTGATPPLQPEPSASASASAAPAVSIGGPVVSPAVVPTSGRARAEKAAVAKSVPTTAATAIPSANAAKGTDLFKVRK